jgi:hypothetical protein
VLGPLGEIRQGHADGEGWRVHPVLGTAALEGMQRFQFRRQADWRTPLEDAAPFESMRTVAREELEGQDGYVPEFVAKARESTDLEKTKGLRMHREYYEVDFGLLVGVRGKAASPMGETQTLSLLSDCKDFGGGLSARKTTVKAAGQTYEILFSGFEYDEVDP